jgi:predicted  nucleic acid-binding Zn-ribbon protein
MGWEEAVSALISERNAIQYDSYVDIYSAYRLIERKHRHLKKKHIEIRNRIGVLQYEIQEAIYQKNGNLEEFKSKLSVMADDLSPRSAKEFDDIKVRFELSRRIKEQEYLISDLKSEADTARSQLSSTLEEVAQLQEEINKKEKTNDILRQELEATRSYLDSAEARLKTVEAENVQYAQRLLNEKQQNTHQMNEMNKLLQSGPGFLGGVIKRFGTTSFFSKTEAHDPTLDEDEIEDDFVDIMTATKKRASEDLDEEEEFQSRDVECIPPRKALYFNKCHNSEINDLAYNKQLYMTGGSDSVLKIFERKGGGQSPDMTSAAIEELPPNESHTNLITGGPIVSIDLKGDWVAAGCCDSIARIWSVSSGRLRHNLSGHKNKVNSVRLIGRSLLLFIHTSPPSHIRIW